MIITFGMLLLSVFISFIVHSLFIQSINALFCIVLFCLFRSAVYLNDVRVHSSFYRKDINLKFEI